MFSYWEQQSFIHYDHIIIGAGIVGLSAAIELRQRFPSDRILVLERGFMATGASSRNAGFACMGSVTELLDDLKRMSEEEVITLFERRKNGLEKLRKRLGDSNMGYSANGSFELIDEKTLPALDQIDYLNNLLMPVLGKPAFKMATEHINDFGFSSSYARALIANTCEGELNTGMMLRTLIDIALQQGIEIKTGADVARFEEKERTVLVYVPDSIRKENWVLNAATLSICTNAFTKKLLPDEDVVPGRGQVLITKPVTGLKFKGIFHMDCGYFYFRELNGRVLFGGGRNLAFEEETTTEIALNERIQAELDYRLKEIILPGTSFEIDQRWSGIMAFGANKIPIVKAFSDRVFGAFRMGGMGVALGSEVAATLADMVLGRRC